MEKIKQEFPWISYGDLWTLGGVCAIQEMQGPKIPWRPGRIDGFEHQVTPDGRLPDASQAQDHLRQIFGRMGLVFSFSCFVCFAGLFHFFSMRRRLRICLTDPAAPLLFGYLFTLISKTNSFNDQEIVALSGAHAVGRCHTGESFSLP